MTTLSVPVNSRQEDFIKSYVKRGLASNIAAAIRRAIDVTWEKY